jgi:hypothetical protein
MATTTLYRPVGPRELELIKACGWREFPPRLPDQLWEGGGKDSPNGPTHRRIIPAEELPEFNAHIVGLIEVIEEFIRS